MTDRNYILEELAQEWLELGAGIRQDKMEELFMQVTAAAQKAYILTDEERAAALAVHEQLDKDLLASIEGLTDAQWKFKPGPDRWSVQEIVEHVILVETFLGAGVAKTLEGEPDPKLEAKVPFSAFQMRVLDRSVRGFNPPEPMLPKGQWTLTETIERYRAARARSHELLSRPGLPLKEYLFAAPPGTYHCFEWLQGVTLPGRRHLAQIVEVKTTAPTSGFPQ